MNKMLLSHPGASRTVFRVVHLGLLGATVVAGLLWLIEPVLQAASPPPTTPPATTQPAKPAKLSPEQQTLEFLRINEPEVYQSAILLQAKDPKKFSALMQDMSKDVKKLMDIDKRSHDMFIQTVADRRLGYRALQLAKDLRNESLPSDVRKQKNDELDSVLSQQFDTRRKLRMMEIDDLTGRINKLQDQINIMKHQIEDRDQHKDDLVNQRLKELLSANPKVDW